MQSVVRRSGFRGICLQLLVLSLLATAPSLARAQGSGTAAAPTTGTIEGTVTTQNGTIRLAGALISLQQQGTEVASSGTDADGKYRIADLTPGAYEVVATLDGFDPKTVRVTVVNRQTADASLDLPIATVAERVEVSAPKTAVSPAGTLSGGEELRSKR